MRLLVTADLHYNHRHSKPLAEQLIAQMNAAGGDLLLVIGDTATAEGDDLERCLSLFRFPGHKLFVAGNHELWSQRPDSYSLYTDELPRRVRSLGWQWLETEPFAAGEVTIVGSVGWYDYAFARDALGIPRRFYEHKVSPGAAARFSEFAHLFDSEDDIPPASRDVLARWNDGKFVRLHRSDEAFLAELMSRMEQQLSAAATSRQVIAAVHHVPFGELLPPTRGAQWDFARAYLGSPRIGELLAAAPNVSHVLCGHSHFPAEAHLGPIHAINLGSGYRYKTFRALDLK
ncbi:MAG TPA: metallophosphoesterase [Tepidisphaeraceae bacterium]|jgi:predicted phosphodiesterase